MAAAGARELPSWGARSDLISTHTALDEHSRCRSGGGRGRGEGAEPSRGSPLARPSCPNFPPQRLSLGIPGIRQAGPYAYRWTGRPPPGAHATAHSLGSHSPASHVTPP